jgi:hypothetical protein
VYRTLTAVISRATSPKDGREDQDPFACRALQKALDERAVHREVGQGDYVVDLARVYMDMVPVIGEVGECGAKGLFG